MRSSGRRFAEFCDLPLVRIWRRQNGTWLQHADTHVYTQVYTHVLGDTCLRTCLCRISVTHSLTHFCFATYLFWAAGLYPHIYFGLAGNGDGVRDV